MSFVSIQFFAFLAVLFCVYFLVPRKWQWKVLPLFSIWFYISYGVQYIGFILCTVLMTYFMAVRLNRTDHKFAQLKQQCDNKEQRKKYKEKYIKSKKIIMLAGLSLNFGIWAILKYANLVDFLPLGISIYSFVAAGYCIDVYRGKYQAEKNLLKYCSFITFFPHIVQGPFSRYDVLGSTLFEKHDFDFERFAQGSLRMAWGYLKKLVIANRMTVAVDLIMADTVGFDGIYIFWLFILLPVRLYADFSGYMDIAAGLCHILGIRLQENFMQPFFAKSIDEFWRRWHITLGAWFRDYLFYPVSMSKLTQKISKRCKNKFSPATARLIPSYIALIFVWSATGLWHGGSPNFLLWGWINLFCIVTSMQFKPFYARIKNRLHIADENRIWQAVQMIRTFLIFGFAEMVSDTRSIYGIFMKCKALVCGRNWNLIFEPLKLFPDLSIQEVFVLIIGVSIIFIIDVLKERQVNIYSLVQRIPMLPRYIAYCTLLYSIILLGYFGADATEGFMYAQF